jgi:hypothetical protein
MTGFSARRFVRVIQNDALRIMRPVVFTTVVLFGLTVCIYLLNHERLGVDLQSLPLALSGIYLIGTGLMLTGAAFQDMHHRLDRYHYLMLPVSSFERLLSRYLLTGPLFVLYGTLAFLAFDFVGKQLVLMYWDVRHPLMSPFTVATRWVVSSYLLAHVVMLIGAICFRTHAFLRTLLFLLATFLGLMVVENVAERLLFPELYSWTRFERLGPLPVEVVPGFAFTWLNIAFAIGIFAWLLHVAYACLRDHEASDGV